MTSTPRVVCQGLQFTEGPVWAGADLYVTEIVGQRVSRVVDGSFEVVAHTGGGPNGMTLGGDGALYVTNNGGIAVGWTAPEPISGRIQRLTLDGAVTDVLVDDRLKSPNDLCFGPDGQLYFTDPRWVHGEELTPRGAVYRTTLDGHAELLTEGLLYSNGIAFGPGAQALFVAETYGRRVFSFDWSAAGLGKRREFCELTIGWPDGMCFDASGRLYVAATAARGVEVFEPDGRFAELLPTGDDSLPTNCALGPDGSLYVTDAAGGRIFAFDVGAERLPLH